MSTVSRKINTDKAGMIAFLEEKREHAEALSKNTGSHMTRRLRDHYTGEANGLQLAIWAIRDWAEADNIKSPT